MSEQFQKMDYYELTIEFRLEACYIKGINRIQGGLVDEEDTRIP